MRYAIIAAGEGSRLNKEGMSVPKPLVRVCGEQLIDRLIRIFADHEAESISIVCRPDERVVERLCHWRQRGVPLQYVTRTTPSSMHSFYELLPILNEQQPFVLTTVDTIFKEEEFGRYLNDFETRMNDKEADGVMGVTDFIDDEKPLYVKTGPKMAIQAFSDTPCNSPYVSGGIYGLSPRCISTLRNCIARGESHMRNFQRAMLNERQHLAAWPFSVVIDIDHIGDIAKAERLLRQ